MQKPQVIDLRRTYLPVDGETLINNLVSTHKEDQEEKAYPVVPFEGYNFLPTSYGYRSYFGQNAPLGISALTSRVQFIIPYTGKDLRNWFIALAEDGIWIKDLTTGGAWLHYVIQTFDSNIFEEWTYCIIENVMYFYKQGGSTIFNTVSTPVSNDLGIANFGPSFLNMTGQMGIFAAGSRLGMWDTANSVAWSSNLDLTDFTPSTENLAGNTLFADIIGNIVTVKGNGGGFIIYATGSIVGVRYAEQLQALLWNGSKIIDGGGIVNPRSVCYGESYQEQVSFTTLGILRIMGYSASSGKFDVEFVFPEVYDYLREARSPVYLDCVQERFIHFQVFEGDYILAPAYIIPQGVDPKKTALKMADGYWDGDITVLPTIMDGNSWQTLLAQMLAQNLPKSVDTSCLIP